VTPGFRAVDEPHGYFFDDAPVPSPSSVFADLGLVDTRFYTADSRARGRAAHAWLAEAAAGRSVAAADPEIRLLVESGQRLLDRLKARIVRAETALYHPALRFAGTPDLVVEIGGWREIWDYKSGKAPKVARFQTAAYEMLARAQAPCTELGGGIRWRRAVVELQADGSVANRVPHDDHTDGAGWLNLLGAYRIRQALRAPQIAPLEQGE
jgi:hypothetical protein